MEEQNRVRAKRLRSNRLRNQVVSVSSNAKWRKTFDSLSRQLDANSVADVKLLRKEEAVAYPGFLSSLFEDTYLDGPGGVVNYSEIEWVRLPCTHAPTFVCQVDFELGPAHIVIYGYRNITD